LFAERLRRGGEIVKPIRAGADPASGPAVTPLPSRLGDARERAPSEAREFSRQFAPSAAAAANRRLALLSRWKELAYL
jgi:hypothetical protein